MATYISAGSESVLTAWDEESVSLLSALVLPREGKSKSLIGDETETFVVHADTLKPIDYALHQKLLYKIAADMTAFEHKQEADPATGGLLVTGLNGTGEHSGSGVCGEPGCQVEWAGAPYADLHLVSRTKDQFLTALATAAAGEGCRVVLPGLYPLCRGAAIPLSGRPRYHALQKRIESVASGRGHDLSRGTCSIQVNIDTSSENWKKVVQGTFGIQPVVTAAFANSPLFDGAPVLDPETQTFRVSERAVMWFNEWGSITNAARRLILSPDFSISRFVAFAGQQELPILARSSKDGGDIELPAGTSFRDLLSPERLPAAVARRVGQVTAGDFVNALGTCYTPIKVKNYGVVEIRGADASLELRHALGALAVGLFYDRENIEKVHRLTMALPIELHEKLAWIAPRQGLDGVFTAPNGKSLSLREAAQELCAWAHEGLVRRGLGEELYLAPLREIASGRALSPAERTLRALASGKKPEQIFRSNLMPVVERSSKSAAAPTEVLSLRPQYVCG